MPIADAQARVTLSDCFEESAKQLRDASRFIPFEFFYNGACVTIQTEVDTEEKEQHFKVITFAMMTEDAGRYAAFLAALQKLVAESP